MRPCSPIVAACPGSGLSRYWYGLPPWPAAQWARRRQFGASCGAAGFAWRLHALPAYVLSLDCPQTELAEAKIVTVVAASDSNRHTRLWPFRWPLDVRPIDGASPPPPALDPQPSGGLSIII